MKVALVYDRVNKWGGAERVLLALHKIFPNAPLYTSVYDKKGAKWAKDLDVKTSFVDSIKFLRQYNDLLAIAMPVVFESFNFDEYDLVISVTSESAKSIITKAPTMHICICLTPTRYLWSGYEDYFRNPLLRFISLPAVWYLKAVDRIAAKRPDYFIAISTEVKKRIRKYYGRKSEIIFPPIMISAKRNNKKRKEYFLLVSRFSRFNYYKKVDLAIEAFNKSGLQLKIVGGGPLVTQYKAKSNKNIEFLGQLSDEKLIEMYKECKGLVFPGKEDFGLVMAEAISFGAPVVAFKAGGALDIVREGINGEFFTKQNPDALNASIERFCQNSYNSRKIIESAKDYSFANFEKKLKAFINKTKN